MRIEQDVRLAPLTTLGLGGAAKRFCKLDDVGLLGAVLGTAEQQGWPVLVLGGGSNLVVKDAGWDGLVVQIATRGIDIERVGDRSLVWVQAGVVWDELVAATIDEGLAGLECLSGIPGLVGATPLQNVGAYGQEVSDVIVLVRAWDRQTQELASFTHEQCGFSYRHSMFRGNDRYIVVDVRFELQQSQLSMPIQCAELARTLGVTEGERAPLGLVRDTVIALRRGKGMVVDPADPDSRSAGSFFTNPIVDAVTIAQLEARLPAGTSIPKFAARGGKTKLSAGWLIERAGFTKGTVRGRVGISRKHALALINRGEATTEELLALAREIQDGVRNKLGIELVPEPVIT
jgi:UDP-N-acetylmuramate dehydrogenase